MNCPNCGTYYDENEKICKKCHTPLSNAVYNQVSSGNDINQPAPKRKSFVPMYVFNCCFTSSLTFGSDFSGSGKSEGATSEKSIFLA